MNKFLLASILTFAGLNNAMASSPCGTECGTINVVTTCQTCPTAEPVAEKEISKTCCTPCGVCTLYTKPAPAPVQDCNCC